MLPPFIHRHRSVEAGKYQNLEYLFPRYSEIQTFYYLKFHLITEPSLHDLSRYGRFYYATKFDDFGV